MPTSHQIALNEKEYVEEPFLRQLERLGWKILRAGDEGKGDPTVTFREGFNEVILEKKLRESLLKLNGIGPKGDGTRISRLWATLTFTK